MDTLPGIIGTGAVTLFFIPHLLSQWFIAQGLKPDVYYEAAVVIIHL